LSAVDTGLSPPIVKPDTVIDCIVPVSDRIGAGNPGTAAARPTVLSEIRRPIRQMSIANPLWERREPMKAAGQKENCCIAVVSRSVALCNRSVAAVEIAARHCIGGKPRL